jgi:MFS family permease
VAGGLITQAVSWHWIFFVNVPLGIATGAVAYRLLRSDRGLGVAAGADVLGAGLVTAALMLGVYAIVAPSPGLGVLALLLLGAFLVRQARAAKPILPLRLFRSATLSGANAVQALMSAAFLSFFFMASLDLQRVLGYGPMAIGLGFLPVAVAMGILSIWLAARLVMRFGAFRVLVSGQVVIAAALLVLALGPTRADYLGHLLVPMILLGLGGGLVFPALAMIAMAGVRPEDSGLASGLLNTSGQVGGALGLALLATVAAARAAALGGSHQSAVAALSGGYHLAWLVAAGTVIVTIGITIGTLRPRAGATAAQTAPAADEAECAA